MIWHALEESLRAHAVLLYQHVQRSGFKVEQDITREHDLEEN